ncbi:hypothetical protein Goari_027473 [Gossypium aridum]|uniref:Uncharacterized protein n=1 Tax=Gossypium aridum TaxID=34290 RepID=A0A7J8YQI7_GOSAI|nr:hypothetical protein [Gossypium aridum]
MTGDLESQSVLSRKDKLLGGKSSESALDRSTPNVGCENDFELLEGDVNTTHIDGVPAITFSDRIKEILFREMELTVVKLLERNIGYNALYNPVEMDTPNEGRSDGEPYVSKNGYKSGLGAGLVSGSGSKENLRNESLDLVGRLSKASLDKSLGKRPVGMDGKIKFKNGLMAILPNQIPSNDGELNSKHAGASFNLIGDESIQGRLGSKFQTNLNADELEKIKAHYNPIFDKSEGFIIPISNNSLDPGNHSAVIFSKNAHNPQQVLMESRSKELPESNSVSNFSGLKDRKSGGSRSIRQSSFTL